MNSRFEPCHPHEKGPPVVTATPSFFNLLPYKSMSTSTLRPARRTEAPPPAPPVFDPEGLASSWKGYTHTADDSDLTIIIEELGNVPAQERTVEMNITLAQAGQEQQRRSRTAPAKQQQPAPQPVAVAAAPATPAPRPYVPMLAPFEQQLPPRAESKTKRPTW